MVFIMQSFPPLPLELIMLIVEAAASSSRSTALTLSLVSKTIYHWTKPIIYNTVNVSVCNISRFLRGFFTNNFSQSDATHIQRTPKYLIRSLFITECTGSGLINVVNRCEHLYQLLCSSDIIECTTTRSRPREIIVYSSPDVKMFYGDCDESPQVLSAVTHLCVQQRLLDNEFVEAITVLKHLTHLGIFFEFTRKDTFVGGVRRLMEIKTLQSVLILVESRAVLHEEIWAELAEIGAARLVVSVVRLQDMACEESAWCDTKLLEDWRRLVL